jgi:hypothetical protein
MNKLYQFLENLVLYKCVYSAIIFCFNLDANILIILQFPLYLKTNVGYIDLGAIFWRQKTPHVKVESTVY